jgi:drug/metabolite transporter (DMT)-like permease
MKPFLLFLLIAAIGNTTYHIGQKTLSSIANPMILLMAVYGFAFLLSVIAFPFFKSTTTTTELSHIFSWPVIAIAVGAFLIEIGFLLAYRTGGSLQFSGAIVNGIAALTLVPIAIFLFHESLSLPRIAGILLTVSGLALIVRK